MLFPDFATPFALMVPKTVFGNGGAVQETRRLKSLDLSKLQVRMELMRIHGVSSSRASQLCKRVFEETVDLTGGSNGSSPEFVECRNCGLPIYETDVRLKGHSHKACELAVKALERRLMKFDFLEKIEVCAHKINNCFMS